MTIKNMLKVKVSLPAALLIIVAAVVLCEQIFLQEIKADNDLINSLPVVSPTPDRQSSAVWQDGKVALADADIPLMSGAKRLTFDSKYIVSYRVDARAGAVARFYRQILASQGWKTATAGVSAKAKSDKLIITYQENQLSKKTDITYAYVPVNATKVLGVKIADAIVPAPAPSSQISSPVPAPVPTPAPVPAPVPAQTGSQTSPLSPAGNSLSAPVSGGQNQPNQTLQQQPPMMPNNGGQFQPPMMPQQPQNQPGTNQMQFFKEPLQPNSGGQNSGQTCNVNGVNLEGSCSLYNNMGTPGQQGGQMNQARQQGPSEEDNKKMDERRFKDMKRGLSQFSNGAKMMKRNIAKIKIANSKCGVGMPEELENALTQTDSLVAKINEAKTADELDEIISDVQDVGSVMQDWGPRMGDLSRLCQMIKQADRDAKQFDRSVKQMESQAKANKKVDLSELIAEYKTAVNSQKDTLAQVKELAKTDPDSALAKIEDDFYGSMDNLSNMQMQINAVVNISRGMKDINRELNNFAAQIKKLAKKEVDTAEVQSMLDNLKSQVEDLKNAVASKVDPEELISKIEEAFDARQSLQDALQEFGVGNTMPQINAGSNYNVQVNIPDAFRNNSNSNNNDNGNGPNGPGFNQGLNGSGGNGPAGPGL